MERRPFPDSEVNQLAEEIDDSEADAVYTIVLQGLDENDLPTKDKESFQSTVDYDEAVKLYDALRSAGAPCPDDPKTKYWALRLDVQSAGDAWTNQVDNLWLD